MNRPPHPTPFPNPSYFTFLPPNPNLNPNFFHHPHQTPPPPPPPPPQPDLPSTLSTLKNLIHLSETTITSISTLLHTPSATAATSSSALSPCPFNPHHRVPPESLFRHSLQCPSSAAAIDLSLVESLHYPNTLQSSQELVRQNRFVRTLHDSDAELCFSIDDYSDFGSNFFYRDCPGVVTVTEHDGTKRTFTLPGTLSVECANFVGSGDIEIKGFSRECAKLLPSELWLVRNEIEAWNDYPASYSYSGLRAVLCLCTMKECDILRWVIVNSPGYGIVIDVPMRDHIVLLFRLCLKAILREAVGSADLVFNRGAELNLATMWFECSKLVEVLKWFSFQLSVLYGEVNGKFFAINMLKKCILNASLNSLLFPIAQKAIETPASKGEDGNYEEPLERSMENERNGMEGGKINSIVIFVSQVAAAVAALHERSLFEEKIKAFRVAQPRNKYQRIADHAYVSRRADEERQKRLNYKPVIEHDSLFWQRSRNQDTNRMKTREELLAEERDYKRRRMSYRGKKLKRTTTQMLRDIIEDYTEEIKQAGGIGCLLKGTEDAGTSKPFSALDISTDNEQKKTMSNSNEVSSEQPHGYREQSNYQDNVRFTRLYDESPEDHKHYRRDSHRRHEHLEYQRSVSRDRRDREYTRSPDGHRSNGRSDDYISNRGQRDDVEVSRKYFPQSRDRSHSRSHERTNRRSEKIDHNLEAKDRRQRNKYRGHKSDYAIHQEFEDRYDPSESHDSYKDDVSSGSKYVRPD